MTTNRCRRRTVTYASRMDRQPDNAVASQIIQYLDRADEYGQRDLIGPAELTQEVVVLSANWQLYVDTAGITGEVRNGVETALDAVAGAGDTVNRELLMALAGRAGDGTEARVASWFITMCWGAGPRENFRVRQWRKALQWEHFTSVLAGTHHQVTQGNLVDAHRGAWMPGTAEAFFTKWLWALGLGGIPGEATPYVLDARVWDSLSALKWWPEGPNKSHRWVDYCQALDRWAEIIQTDRPDWSVSGDRLEQLLFRRSSDGSDFYASAST